MTTAAAAAARSALAAERTVYKLRCFCGEISFLRIILSLCNCAGRELLIKCCRQLFGYEVDNRLDLDICSPAIVANDLPACSAVSSLSAVNPSSAAIAA